MTKEHLKQILISILIAAGTAFLTTLFQGLLDLIQNNAAALVAGAGSASVYLAKYYKA